jgi:hypothetical protein
MVMTKPPIATATPISGADMGRKEAEEVTKAIKDNFDSLGAMLAQARDRKAYRALGYRSFESYCKTEFGKSTSTAYQIIEDAKLLSQLEEKISETYGEPVTLKIPASHLRPLKNIDNTDDRLRAIEYAQKLATGEGRKPTKQHLEIAIFEISGKRSKDFKSAIQSLGFIKGVQVEVKKTLLKKDRGFVTNVDNLGKVHVELYYGGYKSVPYDATDLRILDKSEKPANPASEDTLSKGDKVKIFAKGFEGKTGEIYIWKPGKLVSVVVEDDTLPVDIAYAELEALPATNKKDSDWESELVWQSGKNTYYYFPIENQISSNLWPTGLTLKPYTYPGSPPEFMENWEKEFSHKVLESLATPDKLKSLVLAQAIELPEGEGKEFVADLIANLMQLFPPHDTAPEKTKLLQENEQLREKSERLQEQLKEAETTIQTMVNAVSTISPVESPESTTPSDFLLEDDWRSVLKSNNFSLIEPDDRGEFIEEYRNWSISFCSPNGGIIAIDIIHTGYQEMFTRCLEEKCHPAIDNFTEALEFGEILAWTKNIINQVEDFCPGQLSLFSSAPNKHSSICEAEAAAIQAIGNTSEAAPPSDLLLENTSEILSPEDTAARTDFIQTQRREILQLLKQENENLSTTKDKKKRQKLKSNLDHLQTRLANLEKFASWKIGDSVTKTNFPEKKGRIEKMEVTPGGMPIAWVEWGEGYEEEGKSREHHSFEVLQRVEIQKEEE